MAIASHMPKRDTRDAVEMTAAYLRRKEDAKFEAAFAKAAL
jgi:hypothetical protein